MIIKARYILFLALAFVIVSCSRKPVSTKLSKKEIEQYGEREFIEGMKFYVLGNYSEALTHFQSSRKSSPGRSGIYFMLAKVHLQKDNNYEEALSNANTALKLEPGNTDYYEFVADLYIKKQQYGDAIRTYKKLIDQVPTRESYYFDLAELYMFNRNYDDALKTYRTIESLFGRSMEVTRQKQQIYLRMNKVDEAVAEGKALIKEFPDESEYKLALAELLLSNNKTNDAQTLVDDVIKTEPENPYAHYIASGIYTAKGQKEKANQELEHVFASPEMPLDIKLNILEETTGKSNTEENITTSLRFASIIIKNHPSDAKALATYADILMMSGKKDAALTYYKKALKSDNASFLLWQQVLTLESQLNRADSVVYYSEKALEIFPNQAIFWLYNGTGYYLKKENEKAADAMEEGRKLSSNNPDLQQQFNLYMGDIYNELKEYEKSDMAFEAVLKNDPYNEHALNNYSYFLSLRNEKLERAREMADKLVKRNPQSSYLDTYAWVLYKLKDYNEAKKYLEQALINSSDGTIIEHYGDVLFQLGMTDKAVEQWKKAKTSGGASELIDKKISDKKLYE